MREKPCRPPMTTGGWLAQEKEHPINEEAEKWDDGTFSAINRALEEHAKTDPLAALESLPRARWWAWLRKKSELPRWLKEIYRPALKCNRIGHRPTERRRTGYRLKCSSLGFRCVADSVTQVEILCRRCSIILEEWADVRCSCLQGLTLNTARWRRLESEGVVWSDE